MGAMKDAARAGDGRRGRSFGYGVAAVAISVGLALAPVPVAWADATGSDGTGSGSTGSASTSSESAAAPRAESGSAQSTTKVSPSGRVGSGPKDRVEPRRAGVRSPVRERDAGLSDAGAEADSAITRPTTGAADDPDQNSTAPAAEVADQVEAQPPLDGGPDSGATTPAGSTTGEVVEPDPAGAELDSPTTDEVPAPQVVKPEIDEGIQGHPVARSPRAQRAAETGGPVAASAVGLLTVDIPVEPGDVAEPGSTLLAAVAVTPTPVAPTPLVSTPIPPGPLSPIAQVLELPGRLVNAVLQALGLTESAHTTPVVPNILGPINDLIFAGFRELEWLVGLYNTPPVQPVVPTMTYTGPTTRPTPTVAQFLNASTAAYVLGSTPGDLVPFTVNGFQLSSTNIFSGMVAKSWVTPEGQVIIAYQGTTGGTNLLFNAVITIAQLVADLQVIFTGTTPLAFYDALDFAQRVRAEAALQGYSDDDIFVTGHSLGGWEAQFVAQQIGLSGIGFEAPGMNTTVPGNGADSMFVNIGTYGSPAPFMSTDLPGLQPFMPPFVPGGGSKPHFGPMVMIGDPAAMTPLYNASTLWGTSLIGSAIFLVDFLGNFFQYHLPGVQGYHLDVTSDPGVVPFLGTARGPVLAGYGTLTIPQLMQAASDDGILFRP